MAAQAGARLPRVARRLLVKRAMIGAARDTPSDLPDEEPTELSVLLAAAIAGRRCVRIAVRAAHAARGEAIIGRPVALKASQDVIIETHPGRTDGDDGRRITLPVSSIERLELLETRTTQ